MMGSRMGIVTSNTAEAVASVLEREGLVGSFNAIVGRDDVRELKPSPEGILTACRAMDVAPGECIYVGDSIGDIEAARVAGMDAFGVRDGTSDPGDLVAAGAVAVLDSVGALVARLRTEALLRESS